MTTKIITRTGKGSAISQAENDSNLSSLSNENILESGTSLTVSIIHQNATIEFTSSSAVAVTLQDITTIIAAADTGDFTVSFIQTGTGKVTITKDATDTFNTGAATIVLGIDEYATIQTAATSSVWNIIDRNSETVINTTPLWLHNTTSTADLTWLGSNSFSKSETTMVDKNATGAIISVTMDLSRSSSVVLSSKIWARNPTSNLTETGQSLKYWEYNASSASMTMQNHFAAEFTIGLNSSNEFEIAWNLGSPTSAGIDIFLVGYTRGSNVFIF